LCLNKSFDVLYPLSDVGQLTQHNRQMTDMTLQQVTQTVNSLVGAGQGSPLITHVQGCIRQEMGAMVKQ